MVAIEEMNINEDMEWMLVVGVSSILLVVVVVGRVAKLKIRISSIF